jgi:2-polyprenyl-3-methyl-5-hydroxy-6-metoxy-1,4-benzoquinol methylase
MRKLKLLPRDRYPHSEEDNPLPLYYWPVVGKLYRERVELCLGALNPGLRVLEVGFGSGVTFPTLADLYSEIHGIDLHADIDETTGAFARLGIEAHLRRENLLELGYADGFFDAVLCISILEHLRPAEQPAAMRQIARVLKPGGRFVYGVPVERRLMVVGFRMLGYDIRTHHFSTERDVSAAADAHLRRLALLGYAPFGGMLGRLYEVGVYEAA